jgi:hypothetical protein
MLHKNKLRVTLKSLRQCLTSEVVQRAFGWGWTGVSQWGRVAPQGCPGATATGKAIGKAGGAMAGERSAALLCVALPDGAGSLEFPRFSQGALQLAVRAHHKTATARRNTKQEIDRAKVAIGDLQIVLFDQGQDLAQQRTFLHVPIFIQDDLGGQHLLLVQYHRGHTLAWVASG